MADRIEPHPLNVDGPFYVANGCCTACGVPESIAPELFAWDPNDHCFVRRQPSNEAETNKMLRAVRNSELDCIRYRGRDPDILQRFAELGVPQLCDVGSRFDISPILRNQVTFALNQDLDLTPGHVARRFRDYFLNVDKDRNRTSEVAEQDEAASLSCSWYENNFHKITFQPTSPSSWLIHHAGNLGVSDLLHEWLTSLGATDICWFADSDLSRTGPSRSTPW